MISKDRIRYCFNSAAYTYDSVAEVQKLSSEFLVHMLQIQPIDIETILDIGCGTGYTALALNKKYPNAQLTLCDIAPTMLEIAAKKLSKNVKKICCDAETYTFPQHYDLAIANLSLQWFSKLPLFILKIKDHCHYFAFSLLLNTSFQRYKVLFETPPTFDYPSKEQLRAFLPAPKLFIVKRYTQIFPNLFAVAKYFKKLGAYMKSNKDSAIKANTMDTIFLDYDICFVVC